jgi:mono/diheme cytochrome c family protein
MRRLHLHRAAVAAVSLLACAGAAHGADAPGNAGRAVYERWCSHCHDPGVQHPGTNALTVKYKGAKSGVIREWKDLTPELVRFWVRNGISVMAPFRKTEIDDAQLAALAQFLSQGAEAPRP